MPRPARFSTSRTAEPCDGRRRAPGRRGHRGDRGDLTPRRNAGGPDRSSCPAHAVVRTRPRPAHADRGEPSHPFRCRRHGPGPSAPDPRPRPDSSFLPVLSVAGRTRGRRPGRGVSGGPGPSAVAEERAVLPGESDGRCRERTAAGGGRAGGTAGEHPYRAGGVVLVRGADGSGRRRLAVPRPLGQPCEESRPNPGEGRCSPSSDLSPPCGRVDRMTSTDRAEPWTRHRGARAFGASAGGTGRGARPGGLLVRWVATERIAWRRAGRTSSGASRVSKP